MNKKIFFFPTILFLFILFSVSIGTVGLAEKTDYAHRLIGCWFGTHQQAGIEGDIQAISIFNSDGTFYIRFRIIQNGKPVYEQNESGTWELKDNIKIMVTTHINGKHLRKDKYITDRYYIQKLTDSEQDYEHMENGTKFKSVRVNNQFNFP
jgi:hypothetical protein